MHEDSLPLEGGGLGWGWGHESARWLGRIMQLHMVRDCGEGEAIQRLRSSTSRARTSRLPTWLAVLTTPSASMRSIIRAARL